MAHETRASPPVPPALPEGSEGHLRGAGTRAKVLTLVDSGAYATTQAVATVCGLSKERVRQILELDFYQHATVLHLFEGKVATTRMVSAMDVAHALARELSIASDLLPEGALWWVNTADGPVTAIWEPPRVWKVALQVEAMGKPQRFRLPMPGLIFLCRPGLPPWVFAAKKRPTSEQEAVYKAPLFNVFQDGRVCPGTHRFPMGVAEIPDSFFRSYFSPTGDYDDRSKKSPKDLRLRWKSLNGVKEYPLDDLVPHGTVRDIKNMPLRRCR